MESVESIISAVLAVQPVPFLHPVFNIFRFIYAEVQAVSASRAQLNVLTSSVAQLLYVLDSQCKERRITQERTSSYIRSLMSCVFQDIALILPSFTNREILDAAYLMKSEFSFVTTQLMDS